MNKSVKSYIYKGNISNFIILTFTWSFLLIFYIYNVIINSIRGD